MSRASILPQFKGSKAYERWFKPSDNINLKIFEFKPVNPYENIPIVIVTGLVTIIDSFHLVVEGLSSIYPVYYVETRDKTTSIIQGDAGFDIETMGKDLSSFIKERGLKNNRYCMIGYSMGAAIVSECYHIVEPKPLSIILMEPTAEFIYPRWSLFLIRRIGVPLYNPLKVFAKWYLGRFYINTTEDNRMAVISSDSLDNADPAKIRNTILAISGYKIYSKLPEIRCQVLIVGTSKDSLHSEVQMKKMLSMIDRVEYIDLETNERTHNEEMVKVTREFIERSGEGIDSK